MKYDYKMRDFSYHFFGVTYTKDAEIRTSPVFLADKFSFSPGHSHPIERKMSLAGIVWCDNTDLGVLTLLVHDLIMEYDFFSFLHSIFLEKEYSHIHVCVLSHSSVYLYPRSKFCQLISHDDFWLGAFSRESVYRPLYFSYKGQWRRTYFKRMHISKKLIGNIKLILYATGIHGDIYTFCNVSTLLIYVPPLEDTEKYLQQIVIHFVRMSGRISLLREPAHSNSCLTSYDVCHWRPSNGGICNSLETHKRFCNLVGVNVASPVFTDPYHMYECSDSVCPGSVDDKYMNDDFGYITRLKGTDGYSPIWKYFCGICAYPHSRFGLHLKHGGFLCGKSGANSHRCYSSNTHPENGPGCAARFIKERSNYIQKFQYKVSSYSGEYCELDSIWRASEEVFLPSFGSQLIFYNSYDLFTSTISKSRKTMMCTCMIADVVCDSRECRRSLMLATSDFCVSANVLKTPGLDVLFPDDPRKYLRPLNAVVVPDVMKDWIRKIILYERTGGDASDYSWVAPFRSKFFSKPDNG